MAVRPFPPLSKGIRIGLLAAGSAAIVIGILAWLQLSQERKMDLEDLDRRAHVLAHQAADKALAALSFQEKEIKEKLSGELEGYRRLVGFAVFKKSGELLAAGKGVGQYVKELVPTVDKVLQSDNETFERIFAGDLAMHILATPLQEPPGTTQGVLVVVHDASHLEDRAAGRLIRFGFWILLLTVLLLVLVVGATWAVYDRPLQGLAEWMKRLRTGDSNESPPRGLPVEFLTSESNRLAASFRAARATGWSESREVVREHNVWTRDRLRAHAIDSLHTGQLVVVSNREPYMHVFRDGAPQLIIPAGGLVTALDPVLQACGGLWIAHGSGDADRQTTDKEGRITVPPDDGRYTLRRIWLTREEEQGYYYGFANEGLWPLCHIAHERPVFRASDWEQYARVNQHFADAVLDEVGSSQAMILVQDYQLALVPQMVKAKRPDLRVGIFWHIPWPNPEAFRICPWRSEILHGMLGADLIGFHLQQYCNNFLDTVDRMVEARLNWDHFAVDVKKHTSLVRPFPISIESWKERKAPTDKFEDEAKYLREKYKLGSTEIVIGVERVDYTKGIAERFRAIARFFEINPQYIGKYSFVVLGAPSRTHIRRYRDLLTELETIADEINWKFQANDWKPLHFLVAHHDYATVYTFMRMSSICIVSALHDGMNLVAKEYVAAREDGNGVLILSEFAGAARELADALIINPYDTEHFAKVIASAIEMKPEERRQRMNRMRRIVEENNVYRWAATLLTDLSGNL